MTVILPKSHLKSQKITLLVQKDEDNSLLIFDKEYSINVVFEPEVLQENLHNSKMKNIHGLVDHHITVSDANLELITFNNAKNGINSKLVLHIKNFDINKGTEQADEIPKNVNFNPKVFFLIQEYSHRMLKKVNRAKHPTNIIDADSIVSKVSSTKIESFRKIYEEKTGYIKNLKKIDDFYNNQIDLANGNKIAEESRNGDLSHILSSDIYGEDEEIEEEEVGRKENKGKGKSAKASGEYPSSLTGLMEKYSAIIPTIKKGTILKFKSLKEQNEGN